MKISFKRTGIFILHWIFLTLGQCEKGTSRCAAPATELMKEATITCLFPFDVSLSKTDFTVYREKHIRVAECMWVRGRLDCTLEDGYERDDQPAPKTFTLRIPNFLKIYTGNYTCVLQSYDFEECSLLQRTVLTTSVEPTWQITVTPAPHVHSEAPSLTPETDSNRHGTSDDDKATSTVLIIVVTSVGACLAVASAVVVVYVVYKCVRGKRSPRKPDHVTTVETGGSCDTPLVARQPTPETTAGHQADVTTSLLSETDDRSQFCEHCNTSNFQQVQVDRELFISPSRKTNFACDHVTYRPALHRSITARNHCRCCRHDVSREYPKARDHDACKVCGSCGATGERHVTKASEDSSDEDEHCKDMHTCNERECMGTPVEISKCLKCHLLSVEGRAQNKTGKHDPSKLTKEMFPGIQMQEGAQPSPVQ